MAQSPEKITSSLVARQDILPSEKALSLLQAVAFTSTFSSLSWTDEASAATLLGTPPGRLPKTPDAFEAFLADESRLVRETARASLIKDGNAYTVTYAVDAFDGREIWIEERGERIRGQQQPDLIIGALRDVTERQQSQLLSDIAVNKDPLTGLWNRGRFLEALDYEIAASELRPIKGYVAAFSLIGLENIRSEFGREATEDVLVQTADRLQSRFALPNFSARISKSGFGLLLPGSSKVDAQARIKSMANWISKKPHPSLFGELSISCNVSVLPLNSGVKASQRLSLLETQAQPFTAGFSFPQTENERVQAPIQTYGLEDILSALNTRKLALAYQPIFDARTRRVNHFEGLMRLIKEDGNPMSAGHMIMAAEDLGYVNLLDRRALEIGGEALQKYPNMHLAVNVSVGTLRTDDLVDEYLGSLKALGPNAQRLTLELTETMALEDQTLVGRFAEAARKFGCRFAIDDFGSGHTTFKNLTFIEADIIKIDGHMVRDLSSSPHKQSFVRMIVDLAETLNIETVAEMVSSEADAQLMTRLGVTYLQGFIFGRPLLEPDLHAIAKNDVA